MISIWSRRGRIVLGVVGLLLVCMPVVGARVMIMLHTRDQAQSSVQELADQLVARAETAIDSGSTVLAELALRGVNSCSSDDLDFMRRAVFANFWIKEVGILGPDDRLMCNHLGDMTPVRRLSDTFPTANPNLHLQVVEARADGRRGLMLVLDAGGGVRLDAIIPSDAIVAGLLPSYLADTAVGMVTLADGTVIGRFAQAGRLESDRNSGPTVLASAQSTRFPVQMQLGAPFGAFRVQQSDLLLLATAGGGLISTMIFALFLYVLRGPPTEVARMREALARGEFIPFYQPVIDIETGRLAGCEVLIRWRKGDGTVITPDAFISRAEESGLAWPMTLALMRRVRADLDEVFGERPWLKIGINLFNAHFSTLRTARDVANIFGNSHIKTSQLVFELTEREPLGDVRRARVVIRRLQELGAKVALDDAGTGHAGLAYLHQLGVDVVKIDKLFVDTITMGTPTPIIDSLIRLGHDLKMEVVAEGVETFEQLDFLRAQGADQAQGYLFSPPLPTKAFVEMVEAMEPHARLAGERAGRRAGPDLASRVA